jgi:lipoate-protein ligase A
MGVDAGTAGKDKAEKTEKLSYQPCFASATKYELEYKGKKIVGSAQRRDSKAFLQHGSILLNFNEKELLKSIGAEISESDPAEYMTSISKILNYRVGYADAIKKLILGFEETFKIEMVYDKLNPREIEAADFLDSVKYSSEEWNHSK